MTLASRSILTRSSCVSVGLRIASMYPVPPAEIPVRDFPASVFSVPLWPIQSLTPLESALTKNPPASPLESALTKYPGGWGNPCPTFSATPAPCRNSFRIRSYENHACKSFRIRSYKNTLGGGGGFRIFSARLCALRVSALSFLPFVFLLHLAPPRPLSASFTYFTSSASSTSFCFDSQLPTVDFPRHNAKILSTPL